MIGMALKTFGKVLVKKRLGSPLKPREQLIYYIVLAVIIALLGLIAFIIHLLYTLFSVTTDLVTGESVCSNDTNSSGSLNPGNGSSFSGTVSKDCVAAGKSCPGQTFDSINPPPATNLVMPLSSMPKTSSYGWRFHPIRKVNVFHAGADYSSPLGTPIYAIADGVVVVAKMDDPNYTCKGKGPGSLLTIKSNIKGQMTFFNILHANTFTVSVGQNVRAGQQVATVGSKGCSTGPHLHLEVGIGGTNNIVNPSDWLTNNGVTSAPLTTVDPATGQSAPLSPYQDGSCPTTNMCGGNKTEILKTAEQQVGKPYVWGGTSPAGFDCSGLVNWSASQHGVQLTRTADSLWHTLPPVPQSQIQPGDVFFCINGGRAYHTGFVYSPTQQLHAAGKGKGVIINDTTGGWCHGNKVEFGRINAEGGATPGTGLMCGSGTSPESAKAIASAMLSEYGWSESEMPALEKLWTKESSWNYQAKNPSSGAAGIPQCLPTKGAKDKCRDSSVGGFPDFDTNPVSQIKWGLKYIKERYGSPSQALAFHLGHNWY